MSHFRKGRCFATPIVLLLSSALPALAAPTAPSLVSKADKFSVWMPGKPDLKQSTRQMAGAGKQTMKVYSVKTPSVSLIVMPMTLPGTIPASANKQFLDGVQKGFLGAPGAKLVSAKKLSLDGMTGRELNVSYGGNLLKARFYVTPTRSYQVLAVAPQNKVAGNTQLVNKFFESFRILR
jgi:hypothetical protein